MLLFPLGVGWSVAIIVPFSMGAVFGYATRLGRVLKGFTGIFLAILLLFLASLALCWAGVQGLFCAFVLAMIALGPLMVGLACGVVLRTTLKRTRFEQREYLPILLLFLLPVGSGLVESPLRRHYSSVTITTSTLMPVSPERAWRSVLFYEQVKHKPSLLLRLGLSRPIYSYGKAEHVGDEKTCVYDQGVLVKRVTRVEPGRELDFVVVRQTIETCAVRLKSGSFRFEPAGQGQTRVTCTTIYEPFLAPRWAWGPWEEASAHALHEHVLLGMTIKAKEDAAKHP